MIPQRSVGEGLVAAVRCVTGPPDLSLGDAVPRKSCSEPAMARSWPVWSGSHRSPGQQQRRKTPDRLSCDLACTSSDSGHLPGPPAPEAPQLGLLGLKADGAPDSLGPVDGAINYNLFAKRDL